MVYQRMADDSANSVVATRKGVLGRGKPLLRPKTEPEAAGTGGSSPNLALLRRLLRLSKNRTSEVIQSREIGDSSNHVHVGIAGIALDPFLPPAPTTQACGKFCEKPVDSSLSLVQSLSLLSRGLNQFFLVRQELTWQNHPRADAMTSSPPSRWILQTSHKEGPFEFSTYLRR